MWFWLFADSSGSAQPDPSKFNRPVPQPRPMGPEGSAAGPGQPPNPQNPEDEEEEDNTVTGEINAVIRSVMPWLTSLLFHLGIIVLALFVVWSVLQVEEEEAPIIPMARLSDNPGGQLSESQDVELQASQQVRKVVTDQVATDESVNTLTSSNKNKLELVGLAGGGGGGGKMAPFGTTTGQGSGIGAKFFGSGGNATKIIYVVDASGSLIDTLPFVIKELRRSLGELSDKQSFTVIFFQGGREIEVPPKGWKTATPEMKEKVANFITMEAGNIIPRGSTDPVAAIKLAMRYKPELVFILSDNITGKGRYEVDRSELLKLLEESNKDKKIKINTIQFLYPDPLKTLETISKEHGGIHKFITESDLGLK